MYKSRDQFFFFFVFQAEDGRRGLVRSSGLGDVYKRQSVGGAIVSNPISIIITCHRILGNDRTLTGFGLSLIHI